MGKRVEVGIAGLGRSGWGLHANAIGPLSEKYRIAAVADMDPAKREEASAAYQCRTYPDFESLIADTDIELLVVATQSNKHAEHTIAALRAGKNVVCEKPMAGTAAEADEMIKASKEAGRLLTISQNQRYAPDFLKVKEVIDSGKLGRIVAIQACSHGFKRRWDWQTLKEFGGGELNNTGPHALDQLLQLLGESEPEVFCHLDRALTSGDADDHARVILKVAGAPLVELEVSNCCIYPRDKWLVMGTTGGLRGTSDEISWKYTDFSKLPERPVIRTPLPDRGYNSEKLEWTEESASTPFDYEVTFKQLYIDLYESIRNGKPLVITPESIRRQIAILEKCHQICPL